MTKLIYGCLFSLASRVAATSARRALGICVTLALVGGFGMTMQANAQTPPTVTINGEATRTENHGGILLLEATGTPDSATPGETLTYAWTQTAPTAGPAATLSLVGAMSASVSVTLPRLPAQADIDLVFVVTVTSPSSSLTASATATVTLDNRAPVPRAMLALSGQSPSGTTITVIEGQTVDLDAQTSADPEAGDLTYAWAQLNPPGGGPFALNGSQLSGRTTNSAMFRVASLDTHPSGSVFVIRLRVTDEAGQSVSTSSGSDISITVNRASTDPVARASAPTTANENTLVSLDGSTSSDEDGDTVTHVWSQTSGTTVSLINPTSSIASFTTPDQLNADQVLSFRLTVTSGTPAVTDTADVSITVTAGANDAPTAEVMAPASAEEGDIVTLNGSTSSDPEGQTLTYVWTQTAPDSGLGSGMILTDDGTATPQFDAPVQLVENIVVTFGLMVTDPGRPPVAGLSDSTTVSVTINAGPNDPPIANVAAQQGGTITPTMLVVDEGAAVTLNGSSSNDPELEPVTFLWTQIAPTSGQGANAGLSSTTAADPTFTAPTQLAATVDMVFRLTVTDSGRPGGTAEQDSNTVTIQVTAGDNDPPTNVTAVASETSVTEGVVVSLTGSGMDPEDEPLAYTWTQMAPISGKGSGLDLIRPGTATPTFTAPVQLLVDIDLVFQLTVTDSGRPPGGGGARESTTATVTIGVVAGPNDRPLADAGPTRAYSEGDTVTLDGSGSSDPEEDDQLTYKWTQSQPAMGAGASLTLSDDTAVMPTFTVPDQVVDDISVVFQLVVTDSGRPLSQVLSSVVDSVTLTLGAGPNDPPSASAGAPQTVSEGQTVTLDASGSSDPEQRPLMFEWTQLAPTSGQGANAVLSSTTAADPTFTAPSNLAEDAVLTFSVQVTDHGGSFTGAQVVITVSAGPNDAPTAEAGAAMPVRSADNVTVTLNGSASRDPESEPLTYSWAQTLPSNGRGSGLAISNAGSARPSFVVPTLLAAPLSLVFELTVTDSGRPGGTALSGTDTVLITVNPGDNQSPVARISPVAQSVAEGALVTLNGATSSDPEMETLTFAWRQTFPISTQGADVALSSTTAAAPTFTAPPQLAANVDLIFELRVTDGRFATSTVAQTTISVTAGPNDPPLANAGPTQANRSEGAVVFLDGRGSNDPEQQPLIYAWTQQPHDNPRFNVVLSSPSIARPFFSVPANLPSNATLVFNLTVTDAGGLVAMATTSVSVVAGVDDPPVANAGARQNVAEGALVTLDGGASIDPEGRPLAGYRWAQKPNAFTAARGLVELSGATTQSPTFTAPTELQTDIDLEFDLVVTDAGGLVSPINTVRITVRAGPNDAPTANAGDDLTTDEGVTVTLDGLGSNDPEDDTLAYLWVQTAPTSGIGSGLVLNNADTATLTFVTPRQLTEDITLIFVLTVVDQRGMTLTDTVEVAVTISEDDLTDGTTNEAILPEVTNALTSSAINAITQRIGHAARASSAHSSFSIGGQNNLASALNAHHKDDSRDLKQLLSGSGFALGLNAAEGSGHPPTTTFWGSGEFREVSGDGRRVDWQGEMSSIHLGLDASLGYGRVAGVAVSQTRGEFEYKDDPSSDDVVDVRNGTYDMSMNSVHPYISTRAAGADVWATVGYGQGKLEIVEQNMRPQSSDLQLLTVGVGGSGVMLQRGTTSLSLKGEATQSEMQVADQSSISALELETSQLRMTLDGRQSRTLVDGGTLEPGLEVGLRYDGGDGDTGSGAEIGGRVNYRSPSNRITVEGRIRALVGHSGGYEEWGIQGDIVVRPGTDGQGFSATFSPGYGDSNSGVQQLWQDGIPLNDQQASDDYQARINARFGWGLPVPQHGAMLTPYSGMTFGETDSLRVGLNWASGRRFDLDLLGERRQSSDRTENSVLLKGTWLLHGWW